MSEPRKHWTEIGRVKNSAWFRRLSDGDRAAVLASLEHDTHESALRARAVTAFTGSVIIYSAGASLWALAVRCPVLWPAICGGAVGAALGGLSVAIINRASNAETAADMQRTAGSIVGLPGVLFAGAGLVVWLFRAVIF